MARRQGALAGELRALRERAVLDAAADVLSRRGPEGFSVRDVAKSAGASTMVIYTLFGGREGLLDALWRDGLERIADAFDRVPDHGSLSGLARLARAYRRFAVANKQYYFALSAGPRLTLPVRQSRAFQILVDAVRRGLDAGLLARNPPELVADALWGLVHGMVSLELGGHFSSPKVAEERLLRAGAALLSGLRAGSGEGASSG
jgi:AcrR family transcriptional regulator